MHLPYYDQGRREGEQSNRSLTVKKFYELSFLIFKGKCSNLYSFRDLIFLIRLLHLKNRNNAINNV